MDFGENEKQILKFWQENKIFEKLRKKNKGKAPWSFLDGPITANNPMGVHHGWGSNSREHWFLEEKARLGLWLECLICQNLKARLKTGGWKLLKILTPMVILLTLTCWQNVCYVKIIKCIIPLSHTKAKFWLK